MANNRTVALAQLGVGKTFLVNGNITYCRITSQIAGEELAKSDLRRTQKGWLAVGRPHTTIQLCNASVICNNPQAKTPEEIYGIESLFVSASEIARDNGGGYSFTGMNKGKYLPWVGVAEGNVVNEIHPSAELAVGLNVTLLMRVFQGKPNKGVTLDGVIVNEPIRYATNFGVKAVENQLASMGLTFVPSGQGPQVAMPPGAAQTPQTPYPDDMGMQPNPYADTGNTGQMMPPDYGQHNYIQSGMPGNTMQNTMPPTAPQGNPFSSSANAVYNAAGQMPNQMGSYTNTGVTPAGAGTMPTNNGAPAPAPTNTQGITYDPATGGRNY